MTRGANKRRDTGSAMGKQLAAIVVTCICLLATASLIGIVICNNSDASAQLREEVVELNALGQAGQAGQTGQASQTGQTTQSSETADAPTEDRSVALAQDALRRAADQKDRTKTLAILAVFGLAATCLVALAAYLFFSIVRPFTRLQGFAENVAAGNLDLPLEYERTNPFGKFAWAFDHMRSELKRARASEAATIEGNKTAMASLAHDLRTPVASIRAYAEALDMGLDRTEEERRAYVQVIERKCDEVSQLTDDMLTHSLANLDRIDVACAPFPAKPLLLQAVEGFGVIDARLVRADDAVVAGDEMRLRQAIENLLANAAKYAPGSQVEITGDALENGFYRIGVRDFGPGMAAEDLPFAFDRFYRGANAQDAPGAGLGLFVVKYVVERMNGRVMIQNAHPGTQVTLDLPRA